MDGTALARILHVTGRPSPSHLRHPIVVVQSPLFNCCPQLATVVFIDIVAIGGGGGIIAFAIAVVIAVAVSAIAVIAVIIDVHHCCPIFVFKLPSSNCRPQITAVVVINIAAVGSSGGIIANAIAIAVTVSTIAVVAIIVGVHRCCPIVVVLLLLSYRHP